MRQPVITNEIRNHPLGVGYFLPAIVSMERCYLLNCGEWLGPWCAAHQRSGLICMYWHDRNAAQTETTEAPCDKS